MSEIRTRWWFRTLRSTSSSKTATGNTFLGFRKLVHNTFTTHNVVNAERVNFSSLWQNNILLPTTALGFEQSVGNHSSTYQTQNFDELFGAFLLSWKHFPSPLLFCVVPLLWGCSKRLLVQISLILQISAKNTTIFPKQHIWVRCYIHALLISFIACLWIWIRPKNKQ